MTAFFFNQMDSAQLTEDELTPVADEPIQLSTIQTLQSAAIHTGDAIASIPHSLAAPLASLEDGAKAVAMTTGKWVGIGLAGLVGVALIAKKVGLL